jgi:cytochrome c oxidase cbb3-type subunit 3
MILAALLLAQASPTPPNVQPAETTFTQRCAGCHGEDGKGKTGFGVEMKAPDFTSEGWQKGINDAQILRVITEGKRKTGMMAFGERLSQAEIASLVPYLRAFGRPRK